MPLYEYKCKKCGHRFERIQKFSDPLVKNCPQCKARNSVEQLISAPAVQFKGSGWYVTDYGKTGGSGTESSKKDKPAESAAKPAASEPKGDGKSETKPKPTADKKK